MFEYILNKVKHKDFCKSTTTLKFKEDLIEILIQELNGDILEVGTSSGHTTAILAAISESKGFNTYSFDNNKKSLEEASILLKSLGLKNYKLYLKDVYVDRWDMSRMGCVFIDCVHTESNFLIDLKNTELITDEKSIIIAHDYGLVTKDGDSIKSVFENPKYKILKYIGEKSGWNEMGSGKVMDWEGVRLTICR